MMALLLPFLLAAIYIFVGSLFIMDAINNFYDKKYYLFGINVMLSVWMIIKMIQLTILY
jgi:hypothetical protein